MSALCSILNEIHRLNFTWLLIRTKPLLHWWTEQFRLIQAADKWYSGDSSQDWSLFLEFYVHGTLHLSNTNHINTNEMQNFSLLFGVITLHVSDAVCVHHQEYYKL